MMVVTMGVQGLLQRRHGRLGARQVAGLQGVRKRGERVGGRGTGARRRLRQILHERRKILLGAGEVARLQVGRKRLEILLGLRCA